MNFEGQTIVVTGSTRGLGKSIAERFASLGANVIINGRKDTVFEVKDEFIAKGYKCEAIKSDVSSWDGASLLIETTIKLFGKIDVLVNNAGITNDKLMLKMNEADWDSVLDINLKSAFMCTKFASRYMLKQRKGRIINITSVVGIIGNVGQTNYSASKAGMIGLTKSTAKEIGSRGITCNAVAPGFISTDMTEVLNEQVTKAYLDNIPLKRFGTPDDVANVVEFLASEKASYITGQVIDIDGGLVM